MGKGKETWVVVANSSEARIFSIDANYSLQETDILEHNESRLHVRDLSADRPGKAHDITGVSRFSMGQQTPIKDTEANIFADELSKHLNAAFHSGSLERIYLAATPSFLGVLRPLLSQPVSGIIVSEVAKDLTKLRPEEIKKHFPYAH